MTWVTFIVGEKKVTAFSGKVAARRRFCPGAAGQQPLLQRAEVTLFPVQEQASQERFQEIKSKTSWKFRLAQNLTPGMRSRSQVRTHPCWPVVFLPPRLQPANSMNSTYAINIEKRPFTEALDLVSTGACYLVVKKSSPS
ncbi:unnamed protein product [Soboliphyme baturini]|uniref:Uncharacterized protein n=1 Tax=Soboliphyme baturini TaxID=241478 RepID=A0A183J6Y0_9BILA|nr:unnamed protein product [Soboliphyme baturini]